MPTRTYLLLMLAGFVLTVLIETAVLLAIVSRRHSMRVRLFAGVWLSACTYPVVWLVLPPLFESRWLYLLVAETFAPLAEIALFWFAFIKQRPPSARATARDLAAILIANLCSFGVGEVLHATGITAWWMGEPGA